MAVSRPVVGQRTDGASNAWLTHCDVIAVTI